MKQYTIRDLQRDFPTNEACLDWLMNYFYPDGIFCKKCQKVTKHYKVKSRQSYSCDVCGNHVHPTANTIFHKSTTPLTLWFYAIYLMASTRAGISAKQLERELGVTYKTAWRMFHQIRTMMSDDGGKLSGEVEVDETFVGGKVSNRKSKFGVGSVGKEVVMGMVQRGGIAHVRHVPNTGKWTLLNQIKENVAPKTMIYSDEWKAYKNLPKFGYGHDSVVHSAYEYARGNVHTQNVENLWSHIKRGITGVYRHVDAKYLQSYVNEYAFRYSKRNNSEPMFLALLGQIQKA